MLFAGQMAARKNLRAVDELSRMALVIILNAFRLICADAVLILQIPAKLGIEL
jgi:hypothetical protein